MFSANLTVCVFAILLKMHGHTFKFWKL